MNAKEAAEKSLACVNESNRRNYDSAKKRIMAEVLAGEPLCSFGKDDLSEATVAALKSEGYIVTEHNDSSDDPRDHACKVEHWVNVRWRS